jgi:hypothetical protein
VRRRWSIEERSSSEGAQRKGADGGDARTESGVEEGLRWWKAGDVDTWVVGEACATLGRGRARRMACGGEENRSAADGFFFKEQRGTAVRGRVQ